MFEVLKKEKKFTSFSRKHKRIEIWNAMKLIFRQKTVAGRKSKCIKRKLLLTRNNTTHTQLDDLKKFYCLFL